MPAVLAQQMAAVNATERLANQFAHTVDTTERLAGLTEEDR